MTGAKISSLADVRPGDIFFGPIGGAVGIGVGLGQALLGEGWSVGPLKIRHVGIVVEAASIPKFLAGGTNRPLMVQAMPGGAEEIEMTPERHWTSSCAYVRLPEDYPGQAQDAAAIARLMVAEGVAYSFASYGALALWHWGVHAKRLERWIGRRRPGAITLPHWGNGPSVPLYPGWTRGGRLPVEAICSVLVDQAWTLAGKLVMDGVPHQVVTPGALAGRLLFETEGVQWSFPDRK